MPELRRNWGKFLPPGKSPPGRGPLLPSGASSRTPHPLTLVQGGLCCLELAREADRIQV